ncbi:MAG: hypothetical protein HRU20_25715 [Pseudomonadales bacterium]|nr:hypothetical protein [Pseudomonadales bacterium]
MSQKSKVNKTKAQLKKLWASEQLSQIVCINASIIFLYPCGLVRGVMVDSQGRNKYFDTDKQANAVIELIKGSEYPSI